MSEEEKKAIELLKDIADIRSCVIGDDLYEEDALTLLNLIENQQNKIASQKKQIKLMQSCDLAKVIEKQQKEIEELKAFYNSFESGEIVSYPIFKQRYISKDKIRAKINWLESQFDEGIESEQNQFIIDCVAILEELLEE